MVVHYYLDLPLTKVAEILGIPVGTAKSRLHHGLVALRRSMGEEPQAPSAQAEREGPMTSQHDLDQEIASAFDDLAPVRPPDYLLPSVISRARRTRRWPRWYALVKEPTMHSDSRLAVGSPTARVLAIMVATLLITLMVAGVGVAGSRLLAAGPIVVAQDGSGTVTTIADAVAMAQAGDTILVTPGTYVESIEITKDITLHGDGDGPGDVIIEISADGATTPTRQGTAPYGLRLVDTSAIVTDLSVHGPDHAVGIQVSGGAPTLEDLVIELDGEYRNVARDAFDFTDAAAGTMTNVRTDGFAQIRGGASPTIVGLQHTLEGMLISETGTHPIIHDSTIDGLDITTGAEPVLMDSRFVGITMENAGAPVLQHNTFANPDYQVGDEYDDSALTTAIDILGSDPVIADNRIGDHPVGVSVDSRSAPTIEGNTIEHNEVGLSIPSTASGLSLTGNAFCDNGQNVQVQDGSTLSLDGNTIC